eukprot:355099-Chlamydomonas_euryale.AAC.5
MHGSIREGQAAAMHGLSRIGPAADMNGSSMEWLAAAMHGSSREGPAVDMHGDRTSERNCRHSWQTQGQSCIHIHTRDQGLEICCRHAFASATFSLIGKI